MKVFISHKKEDELVAMQIAIRLKKNNVEYYLDTLDPTIAGSGERLTEHIKNSLGTCTDIIVVMSEKTRYSQWVPFEVGMAARTDMPTATYLSREVLLPDFLSYWPRLRSDDEVDTYVRVRNATREQMVKQYGSYMTASLHKAAETRTFYSNLKKELK
jgi:hypothetical protein